MTLVMPQINIADTAQRTGDARRRTEEEKKRIEREKLAEEARQERLCVMKAQGILDSIPAKMAEESDKGHQYAVLCDVDNEYDRPRNTDRGWNECLPEWLTRSARLVWDAVEAAGLKPTLEFWHDGIGEKSGHNIVIHWPVK